MFNVKTIAVAAVTSVVVVLLAGLVGNNQSLSGKTRFPNSDVTMKSLELDNGSATTSLIADKICITATENDGGTQYLSVGPLGWATSSTSCL